MIPDRYDLPRLARVAGTILFVCGLAVFAYLGVFNRYYADDWCYNADFKELGPIGALRGYAYITTYASNRFSLTLFGGLLYSLGIFGVQIMTALIILLWCLGLGWTLHNLNRLAGSPFPAGLVPALTAGVTYFSIYLAPHVYQSMYWRSGLQYAAALVFGLAVFGLITHQGLRDTPSRLWMAAAAVLSFLGGGFSESGAAALVTAFGLYAAAAWAFRKQSWARNSLATAVLALVCGLLAMLVLMLAPTSGHRLGLYGEPAGLLELPVLTAVFAWDFIRFSLTDAPLPYLALMGTFACLGSLSTAKSGAPLTTRAWLVTLAVMAGITFILIASSYAPSAYIEQAPPAPRARILPRFELVLFLSVFALLTGSLLRPRLPFAWLAPAAGALLLLFFAYTVRTLWITADRIPVYAGRAAIWDDRDALLRQARADGVQELHVRGVDGLPVGGLRDLKDGPGPGYWVNICAERFYGVERIYADIP